MRPTQRDTLQLRIEQALMRASVLDSELTRTRDPITRREIREARQSWRDEAKRLQGKLGRLDRRVLQPLNRQAGLGSDRTDGRGWPRYPR